MSLYEAKKAIARAIRVRAIYLNLSRLQLSDSDITELLPEIFKLKQLLILDLSNNFLTEFNKEFAEFRNLRELYLSKNNLINFNKEFFKLKNLRRLDLQHNSLPFPAEILNDIDDPQKILNFIVDYYEAREEGRLRPLNEAKLVVVGEANVGKTCIINRLLRNKFINTSRTHGIEIHRWKNVELEDKQKVQLNVWDFGGQEIMHSTHQFFFT
jgi:internalin A